MFICALCLLACVFYLCSCTFLQHDSTVAAFLSAMKVFNDLSPPYASSVLVELFNTSGRLFVEIWYRNSSAPSAEPFQMIVPGDCCIIYLCQLL